MKSRTLFILSTLTLIAGFALVVYVWFMTLYPFNIISNQGITIDREVVHQGENLAVTVSFDKNYNFHASNISYFFVNGVILKIPQDGVSRSLGENTFTRFVRVPKDLIKGEYKVRIEWEYAVFPIRQPITYYVESEHFLVTE